MLATIVAADSASTVIKKYIVFIYSEAEPHAKYAIYKHTRKFRVLQYTINVMRYMLYPMSLRIPNRIFQPQILKFVYVFNDAFNYSLKVYWLPCCRFLYMTRLVAVIVLSTLFLSSPRPNSFSMFETFMVPLMCVLAIALHLSISFLLLYNF